MKKKKKKKRVPKTNGGASAEGTFDESNIPWHDAGEAVIKHLILRNAQAKDAAVMEHLQVERESHLLAALGEDARRADVIVIKPPEVSVSGPIGAGLRTCTSIEFKPPTDYCEMVTLLRSHAYTQLAALRHCEDTGAVLRESLDLATVIVSYHKPMNLFNQLADSGVRVCASKDYKGVYTLDGPFVPWTQFVVTSELDYARNGYEWLGWLSTGLTLDAGRDLMDHWRAAGDEEKPMATLVAYVALRANPMVMDGLIREANKAMSDALREVLYPLYGDELKEVEQQRDEAVRKVGELVLEKDEAVRKVGELEQTLSKLLAGLENGGIDPKTLAKAQMLSEASGAES